MISTSTSSTFWENVGTSPSFCSAWFTPPFFLVNPSGWRRKEPTCEGCQNASLASPASSGRNADSMQRRVEVHQKKNHGNICNLTGFRGIYWWFNGFLFMGKPSGNQTWLAENLPPKWMFLGKTMELNWDLNQRSSNKDQASTTLWADTKCSTDVPSLMGHEFYQQTLWWWVANQQTLQMYPLGIKHGNWKSAINAVWMGKSSINDKWLIFQPATVDYLPTQQ